MSDSTFPLVGCETRKYLKRFGLPEQEGYQLKTSNKRFQDGAQYRIELPGVETPEMMEKMVELLEAKSIKWHRFEQTIGIFRLTDSDILRMVDISKQRRVELVLSVGPRTTYDIGAAIRTESGKMMSHRLRGVEQLVRAVEDVRRAASLGVRGILVFDEGLLWLLDHMRKDGYIPKDMSFKASAHMGHCNPASVRLLESIGANSVNVARDLDLPMISAIREATSCTLDIHVDTTQAAGGFIRHYEAPEFVRVASPVFI